MREVDQEVFNRAMELRSNKKSRSKVLETLAKEFPGRAPESVKTIERWDKANRQRISKPIEETIGPNPASNVNEEKDASTAKILREPPRTNPTHQDEFTPTLKYLLSEGLEKEVALNILVSWDEAIISNKPGASNMIRNLVSILSEDSTIPISVARNLAYAQSKAAQFEDVHLLRVCDITKRYRPWEGADNRKAFDTVILKLYPPPMMTVRTNIPIKGIPFVKLRANIYYKQLDSGQWIATALAPTSITDLKLTKENMGDIMIPLTATEGESKNEVLEEIKKACKTLLLPVPYDDRAKAKKYAKEHFGINTMPLEPNPAALSNKEDK